MNASLHKSRAALSAAVCVALLTGCAAGPFGGSRAQLQDAQREARAQRERAEHLQEQVDGLRKDLADAGQALIAIESGLRGQHTRADAVSALAESRILIERAAARAPWRASQVRECRERIEEADRHVQAGHFGSAIFFASRARRIGTSLLSEADRIEAHGDVVWVSARRANLRAGPTTTADIVDVLGRGTPAAVEARRAPWIKLRTLGGAVGWMHESLVEDAS